MNKKSQTPFLKDQEVLQERVLSCVEVNPWKNAGIIVKKNKAVAYLTNKWNSKHTDTMKHSGRDCGTWLERIFIERS